jgi:Flp pilus assembly protein TadG
MNVKSRLTRGMTAVARVAKRSLRNRGEEGSTLVEFAWILPALVALLTGVISFSLAFYTLQQLGNAAGTAVQAAAAYGGLYPVTLGSTSITDPCGMVLYEVTHSPSTQGWVAGKFSYSLVITDNTGTGHTYSSTTSGSGNSATVSFSCTAGVTDEAANEPMTLTLTYAYPWMPIVGFAPTSNLTAVEGAVAD